MSSHPSPAEPLSNTVKTPRRKGMRIAAGIAAGLLLLLIIAVFLPGLFLNNFIREKIITEFKKNAPGYTLTIAGLHLDLLQNHISFDSVSVRSADTAVSGASPLVLVSGIRWMKLMTGNEPVLESLSRAVFTTGPIVVNTPGLPYQARCDRLRLMIADSVFTLDSLRLEPRVSDEDFFAGDRFRRTRLRLSVPRVSMMGVDYPGLLKGTSCRARLIRLNDADLHALVNRDKPFDPNVHPPMPNEAFASIRRQVQINTIEIENSNVEYGERVSRGGPAATVTLNRLNIAIAGIDNTSGPPADASIKVQGKFMQSGTVETKMELPLLSRNFSLHCSGSLGPLDLTRLNSYLVTGEHVRITSGNVQSAHFDLHVKNGIAAGTVHSLYYDLALAVLDSATKGSAGLSEKISSLIANSLKLRKSNFPEKDKPEKIGTVQYTRTHSDSFFNLVWFALRSGIEDIVGF